MIGLMSNTRRDNDLSEIDELHLEFGRALRNARNRDPANVIPQATMARAMGISRASVSNIENGRHRVFLDQVYAAARALGVDPRELLPAPRAKHESTFVHVSDTSEINADVLRRMQRAANRAVLNDYAANAA